MTDLDVFLLGRVHGPSLALEHPCSLVRGDRLYVPKLWADWDEYSFSKESVVLAIDTDADQFLSRLEVPV